jgi:hypothetical protein
MANINKKLDFYVEQGLNVLLIGGQGVGKSSLVLDCFQRNNLKYLYLSAATMDPWVDFVGIPKERKDPDGNSYLELIRPKVIAADEVEAIFLDEFNRAPKKVRNAVMELQQFKSINGQKLNNLKLVWAAINPDDVEDEKFAFDVERLDPAQKDRFHIFIDVPYKLDSKYFSSKYSVSTFNVANEWWEKLEPKVKNSVSPRRVDYALDLYRKGGDMRDVLPKETNVGSLVSALKLAPHKELLDGFMTKGDTEGAKTFINNDNSFFSCIPLFEKHDEYVKFYAPLFNPERVALCLTEKSKIKDFILSNCGNEAFKGVLEDVVKADANKALCKEIKAVLDPTRAPSSTLKVEGKPLFDLTAKCLKDKSKNVKKFIAVSGAIEGKNINAKRGFIGSLASLFPSKLDEEACEISIKALLRIIGGSNKGSLLKTDIVKILNTVIMAQMPSTDLWDAFVKELPSDELAGLRKLRANPDMAKDFIYG